MTSTQPLPSTRALRAAPLRRRVGHRWPSLAVAVGAGVLVWAVWRFFIGEPGPRLADVVALTGAAVVDRDLVRLSETLLDVVSTRFLAAVLLVSSVVALLRRRFALPIQLGVLLAGANITTRVLKTITERPDVGLGDSVYNSWPSGHTTVAASVSAALVLAAPRRMRPVAVLVAVAYTAATGISTIMGGWHRPSDVVAAIVIALGWAALVLALDGRTHPAVRTGRVTALVNSGLLVGGLVAAGFAVAAMARAMALPSVLDRSRDELLAAYSGGALGVLAASCLAFGLLGILLSLSDNDGPDADSPVREV